MKTLDIPQGWSLNLGLSGQIIDQWMSILTNWVPTKMKKTAGAFLFFAFPVNSKFSWGDVAGWTDCTAIKKKRRKQEKKRKEKMASGVGKRLVYEGPFGSTLRILKRVSVFSCGCTLVSVPLLAMYGKEDMSLTQRVTVAATVCAFAIGTTATLRYVSKPYIWRIYELQTKDKPLHMKHFNLIGQTKTTVLKHGVNDIVPSLDRIFVNMGVKEHGSFYVHEEPDCFADDEFYTQVMNRANLKIGKSE